MLEIVEVGNFNYLFNFVHHSVRGWNNIRLCRASCDYFLIIITFWAINCGDSFTRNLFDFGGNIFLNLEKKWSRFLNFCWNLIYFQNETIVSLVFLLKNKKSREKAGELVGYFSRPPILLIIICGIVTCNNTGSALTRWFGFQNGNRFCCRNADTLYVHIYIYIFGSSCTNGLHNLSA